LTALDYREVPPSPALRRFIDSYWFLRGDRGASFEPQPVLPDGRMEIVLNFGERFRRYDGEGGSELQPPRMLVGQMDHHVTIRATGSVDLLGIRFHPTGAHPLLGFAMSELSNRLVPLGDVIDLPDRLSDRKSIAELAGALDSVLMPRFAGVLDSAGSDFEAAIRSAVQGEGRVSVDELASSTGLGPRQLERRFRERVGLGPKRFLKILRFQGVFRRSSSQARDWAEVALDCGYYDQSHFIRDFKSFTGVSPDAFFAAESPLTMVFAGGRGKSGSYNTPSRCVG
jgi:AraC-like DNA-binding protein